MTGKIPDASAFGSRSEKHPTLARSAHDRKNTRRERVRLTFCLQRSTPKADTRGFLIRRFEYEYEYPDASGAEYEYDQEGLSTIKRGKYEYD